VTRGQLPQRAGSLGLNGGGAAAAVPPCGAVNILNISDMLKRHFSFLDVLL